MLILSQIATLILSLPCILFFMRECSCLNQAEGVEGLLILIQYTQLSNILENKQQNNTNQIAEVYSNNELNSSFTNTQSIFDCSNSNLFILNQTSQNSNYTWFITNFSVPISMELQIGYNNPPKSYFSCDPPNCSISIDSNCSNKYSNNLVTGLVYTSSGNFITQFQYYYQCNLSLYFFQIKIQWGFILIIIFSILIIFVSSKFQQAHAFNNYALYVSYLAIGIYCALCLLKFLLIYFRVNNIILAIYYICTVGSFIFGTLSVMVSFCQFMFFLKVKAIQQGIEIKGVKIRHMDLIGFLLGVVVLCTWYFLDRNVIISDFVFVCMYFSLIKFVKFQSLKKLLVLFIINFCIICSFYYTVSKIDSSYEDSLIFYFNNPMFLLFPNIVHIPNSKCAWYSIISMSYGGFFLAYLERFDKNRSSIIYATTFIVSYTLGSIFFMIVSLFTPFLILYELFTIPITVFLLVYFAYRRGELTKLWNGEFYDEQKMSSKEEVSKILLKSDSSMIDEGLSKHLLQNLKYEPEQAVISIQITPVQSQYQNSEQNRFSMRQEIQNRPTLNLLNRSSQIDEDSCGRPMHKSSILIAQSILKRLD